MTSEQNAAELATALVPAGAHGQQPAAGWDLLGALLLLTSSSTLLCPLPRAVGSLQDSSAHSLVIFAPLWLFCATEATLGPEMRL